jgi:hypothetical protein
MCVGLYRILSITVHPLIPVEQDFIAFVEDVDILPTHCVWSGLNYLCDLSLNQTPAGDSLFSGDIYIYIYYSRLY